jgi:predicted transposase YbfD/YdcC
MVNHYEKLVEALGIEKRKAVSRSQLPIILEKVSLEIFNRLLSETFSVELNEREKEWFAIDGKELRGSIEPKEKRGEAVVVAVAQETGETFCQDYYSGDKESEVPVVRKLLEKNGLSKQKVSLDALHLKPKTLEIIAQSGGSYIVGLKENQKQLLKQIRHVVENQPSLFQDSEIEKGHGRIEERSYAFFDLLEIDKEERFKNCKLKTVVKVSRFREEMKSGKRSFELSYYLTNEVGNYEELSKAIRGHWQVETNNHIRDVSLKEDRLRSKKRSCREQLQA